MLKNFKTKTKIQFAQCTCRTTLFAFGLPNHQSKKIVFKRKNINWPTVYDVVNQFNIVTGNWMDTLW